MKLSLTVKILIPIALVFIVIQFIQPARNKSNLISPTDISKTVTIPDSVMAIIKNACYDCHSNNTSYPWYSNIQPVGWFLFKDITDAKDVLNFSEFGGYSPRSQLSKLDEITNEIKENSMPLSSYKMMHKNAQLSANEKALLINWAQLSGDSLSVKN